MLTKPTMTTNATNANNDIALTLLTFCHATIAAITATTTTRRRRRRRRRRRLLSTR